MRTVGLVEALEPRARRAAEAIVSRMNDPGEWSGYTADEELLGELVESGFVRYRRAKYPLAKLVFRGCTMTDVKKVHRGDPVILEANILEHEHDSIEIGKDGVTLTETISHTFETTTTLDEQVKAGFEAGIKAYGEVSGNEGVVSGKAGVELTAKVYGEYQKHWGSSETHSDTVSRTVTVAKPGEYDYEATRSRNREARKISSWSDFNHTVELFDETGAGQAPPRIMIACESWVMFLQVVIGLAPHTKDGRTVGFYDLFIENQLSEEQYDDLAQPSAAPVSFTAEYDNVLAQDIKIV